MATVPHPHARARWRRLLIADPRVIQLFGSLIANPEALRDLLDTPEEVRW
jgi:hypothetical protein